MTHIVVLNPESVLSFTGTGDIVGVDISQFSDTDFISVALPDFPLSSVDPTLCYVDMTSNEDGDFDIGPSDAVAFSNTVVPLLNGDSELRLSLSLFAEVDRAAITGVRFRITATSDCTFRALAFRCVGADWVYAPLDTDSLYGQARRPVAPNGALYHLNEFPPASRAWPVLYRATEPSSSADPRPIDTDVGMLFRTGSLRAASGETDASLNFIEGNFVSIPDSPALDFSGAFTLEAWVAPTDLQNGPMGVICKYNDATGQRGYRLGVNTSGQLVFDWSNNGTLNHRAISSTGTIQAGQWYHIVAVYDTSSVFFYVNGESVGTVSGAGGAVAATTRPLNIGAWNTG